MLPATASSFREHNRNTLAPIDNCVRMRRLSEYHRAQQSSAFAPADLVRSSRSLQRILAEKCAQLKLSRSRVSSAATHIVMTAVDQVSAPDAAAYERARQQFEYFKADLGNPIFMENAGGSQVGSLI